MAETSQEPNNGLKAIFAPDVEDRRKAGEKIKDVAFYLIIGIVSIVVLTVVPLLSGCIEGDFRMNFPQTTEGWILYWTMNGATTLSNLAIFILFKLQAKTNAKKHPNYIRARELLSKANGKKGFVPRSPKAMDAKDYTTKGLAIIAGSLWSFVAISSLIISFNFITLISVGVSTLMSIIFGWVTMLKNEVYWTDEYLLYAEYIIEKEKENV